MGSPRSPNPRPASNGSRFAPGCFAPSQPVKPTAIRATIYQIPTTPFPPPFTMWTTFGPNLGTGYSIPRLAADVLDIRPRWRAVLENEARVGDVDRALTSVGQEQYLRLIQLKWTIGVGAAAHQEAVVE